MLIPAYRVAETIGSTLDAVLASERADEVMVVDDCCPDNSGEFARREGVDVFRLPTNIGKGGALTAALHRAKGTIIILLDGDLGESAREWTKLLEPIVAGEADMTIARFRPALRRGGFGFAKGLAAKTIRFHTGLALQSPMSGQRGMTRRVADSLGRFESGWAIETAMTIDVHRMGFRVLEVPTDMTHSETGRDLAGFKHRYGQFRAVLGVLLSRIFYRRPPAA